MNRSSEYYMLDNVVICKACEQAMIFGSVGSGTMDGYTCCNSECNNKATIWSNIVMDAIRATIKALHEQVSIDDPEKDLLSRISVMDLDKFSDKDPIAIAEWLSCHFKVSVSPTLDGRGKIDKVFYY